jgi:hypothetical protein
LRRYAASAHPAEGDLWEEKMLLECETAESADALRSNLNALEGVEATEPLLKGGFIDPHVLVDVAAAAFAVTSIAATIVATLSALGFNRIKVGAKLTILNVASVEAAIEADRHEGA